MDVFNLEFESDGHFYLFRFDRAGLQSTISAMRRMAANPELNFTRRQAKAMAQVARDISSAQPPAEDRFAMSRRRRKS